MKSLPAIAVVSLLSISGCARERVVTELFCDAIRKVGTEAESGHVIDPITGRPFIEGIRNKDREAQIAMCEAAGF